MRSAPSQRRALRAALLMLALIPSTSDAGWPRKRSQSVETVPTSRVVVARPIPSSPRALVTPNGVTDVPGLGTFYPDPDLVVITGSTTNYTPLGAFGNSATFSVYGPLSRFRTRVGETQVYERSFGGTLSPVGQATVFSTPGLNPQANTRDAFRLSDYSAPLPFRRGQSSPRPLRPTGEY